MHLDTWLLRITLNPVVHQVYWENVPQGLLRERRNKKVAAVQLGQEANGYRLRSVDNRLLKIDQTNSHRCVHHDHLKCRRVKKSIRVISNLCGKKEP